MGRIFYALTDYYEVSLQLILKFALLAHIAGLASSGFLIKNLSTAKKYILFSIAFCMLASSVFFFPPSSLWTAALLTSMFFVGTCVPIWGYYFKEYCSKDERLRIIADCLIFSNFFMIPLNIAATFGSAQFGLGLSILSLAAAFFFSLKLPVGKDTASPTMTSQKNSAVSIKGPLAFLCLFIIVITINSGIMFQVQNPAFIHLEWLASWYGVLPYILALFILRNLPRKINHTYILYGGIAMIGFSYIAFILLARAWADYFIINTLMLGACGIFDLFWWSIMGDMLELHPNPARIVGIGLAANVFGVLLGGVLSDAIDAGGQSTLSSFLALGVVCVTLVLLPPLHQRLTVLLKSHAYLTSINDLPVQKQNLIFSEFSTTEKLTQREAEVASLIIKGRTYRQIACDLHVSENTIKTHVKNIYSKAGVQSKIELMNTLLDTQSAPHQSQDNKPSMD
jgi:DNA-binding CsgD family transcriptional regulator